MSAAETDATAAAFASAAAPGPATETASSVGGGGETKKTKTLRVPVDGGRELVLDSENLVLRNLGPEPTVSWSCFPSKASRPKTIALYDVLWAELCDRTLRVSYAAHPNKSTIRVASLSVPLGPDPPPGSATASHSFFASSLLAQAYRHAAHRRRARVLVNPHAGPGGALTKWTRDALPLFEAARTQLTVSETTCPGEAVGIMQGLDLNAYDCVVVCSGDGLVYEVFNGLAKRDDARTALSRIAVAHIPCGSGNAMSTNLNGSRHVGHCALAIIKGVVSPMDLMSVTQASTGRYLSFLSQSLGIVADTDLGSEGMRWMGSLRFDVGYVQNVLRKKAYPCDLAVKVAIENKDDIKAHYKRSAGQGRLGWDDWTEDGAVESGDAVPGLPDRQTTGANEGLPPLEYGTVTDEVPGDWEISSNDNLATVYCGKMAYITEDAHFFAAASIRDGTMDLVCMDRGPPIASIRLAFRVGDGTFFDDPRVSYRKVLAYRVTPRDQGPDGYLSIDGERLPFEPYQVEVHPGLGRVISRSGVFESSGPSGWQDCDAAST